MAERNAVIPRMKKPGTLTVTIVLIALATLALAFIICPKASAAPLSYEDVHIGDTITFGRFEQDNIAEDGLEPITWQVLDKEDGKVLIITDKVLEMMPFFAINWKHSSIGGYLNSSFINDFTAEEKDMLVKILVMPDAHPDMPETEQGSEIDNKLFLLSINEVDKYFPNAEDRVCHATRFVIEYEGLKAESDGRCDWWLRTAYDSWSNGALISNVDPNGFINVSSHRARLGLRPACWIQLEQ